MIKAVLGDSGIQPVAIFDMAYMSGGLLAFADYYEFTQQHTRGIPASGFIYLGENGDYQVFKPINPADQVVFHYAREMPYLAVIDNVGFILFMDERPQIGRVRYGVEGVEMLESLPEEFQHRPALVRQREMEPARQATFYYHTLEVSTLAAGIYSWSGELYLLGKKPASPNGNTAWWMIRLDHDTGRELSRVRLPTDAAHLTVIPGEHWAFIEKGRVQGVGDRNTAYLDTRSMVIVPNGWIADPYTGRLDIESRAHCIPMESD